LSLSSDDVLLGRKPKARREHKPGSGRSRGKQPGARGRHLPWAQVPDKTVCHRPPGVCGCGADLAGAADAGIERSRQVHDLPPVAVEITQHDVWRVRCGCGREHAGALPADVATVPSSSGVNLRALVTYLIVYQHVPVQRCVQLVADLAGGTGPPAGFCHGMLSRCAAVLADVIKLIKAAVTLAEVAGFDETPLRCGPAGQKKYVLSGSTETAVAYYLGGRDLGSFEAFGILPSFAGSRCTTATPATSTVPGRTSPDTRHAVLTCPATTRTRPSATPPRSGWPRHSGPARPDPRLA
jgi:transposase